MKKMILRFFPKLYKCLGLFRAEVLRPYNSLPKQYRKASFLGYLWNYLLYGCDVGEYNCFSFQDRNSKSKREFVTIRKNRKLDRMFNTPEANKILWDKASFNDYFRHFNKRSYLAINQNTTDEQLNDFVSKFDNYLVKPDFMFYGIGIYKASGLEELKKLRDSGQTYVVEEIITNCDEFAVLNNSSLNTLRCVTCIDQWGVNIIAVTLRVGSKNSIVDNVHSGGTYYHVDVETGIVDQKGMDGYGNWTYLHHPDSGVVMPGYRIPRFNEVKSFVIDIAKHLQEARYVGWDIAITPDSIEVIEGNVSPGADALQSNQVGIYKLIKNYK